MSLASPLWAILRAKARITRHTLASVRRESRLKVVFVSIFALLLWLGVFFATRFAFGLFTDLGADLFGNAGQGLGELVMARLLATFALALLVLLTFSNIPIAFAALFRAPDVPFLLASPISVSQLFLGRFVECVVLSSWASAYLGSPVLLAYGLESGAPLSFYLALGAFFLPFVVLPAATGTILTLGLVRLVGRWRRSSLVALGIAVGLGLFALFRGQVGTRGLGKNLTDTDRIGTLIELMGRGQSPFLPSYWFAQGALGMNGGASFPSESLLYFALLLANALLGIWLATLAAEAWFADGWAALADGPRRARQEPRKGSASFLDTLLRFVPQPTRALIVKDLKVFWRDSTQWSQFILFFGIMALYVANLGGADERPDAGFWGSISTLLNLVACLLILASLTTRFVFPLISLEGRRFWILGLAPLSLRRLMWQKLALSVGSTLVFTLGLMVLSGLRLGLEPGIFWLSIVAVVASTFALSGLAVGLGCLYPNFSEDSPARIVSGMGGTLNFILSLVYVVLITLTLALVLLWQPIKEAAAFSWWIPVVVPWILLLATLTAWIPLRLGWKNLRQVEF